MQKQRSPAAAVLVPRPAKPVLVMSQPLLGVDVAACGALDELALWAEAVGKWLVSFSARRARVRVRQAQLRLQRAQIELFKAEPGVIEILPGVMKGSGVKQAAPMFGQARRGFLQVWPDTGRGR